MRNRDGVLMLSLLQLETVVWDFPKSRRDNIFFLFPINKNEPVFEVKIALLLFKSKCQF